MSHPYWPMFDIRLMTPDLTLRHLREADLPAMAALLPDDAELDPAATTYPGLDAARERGVIVHQGYWASRGTWKPGSWALSFGVFHEGSLIGSQGLEGEDFPVLRTVDSSSFLAPAVRGRGFGKQMRAAVLAVAFGPLAADAAITSAWADNGASLSVSRALGYVENGVTAHRRDDAAGVMVHMRLTRASWVASGRGNSVQISGFEVCLPYFDLS